MVAGLALMAACAEEVAPVEGPNVVLILVDTLRADVVNEPDLVDTPHLNALAADGVVFPAAFSHAPMTLPSHAAMFSSRLPHETGVLVNGQAVGKEIPLLAPWLEKYGFRTQAVISLGTLRPMWGPGLDRGFETYDAEFEGMVQAAGIVEKLETRLDDLAGGDGPFFLFVHFSDPHAPYNTHGRLGREAQVRLNDEHLATVSTSDMTIFCEEVTLQPGENELVFDADHRLQLKWCRVEGAPCKVVRRGGDQDPDKQYTQLKLVLEGDEPRTADLSFWISDAAEEEEAHGRYHYEVQYVDDHIGEVVRLLKERGFYDDALVLFTSDHGEAFWEHGDRGHSTTLYDELLRVPLIIKPPAGDPRHETLEQSSQRLVRQIDLAPTILEWIDLPTLPEPSGTSLLSPLSDPVLVAETHRPTSKRNLVCLRDADFKMIYCPDDESFEMYDLLADPGEQTDVFEERRAERAPWVERLREMAALGAQRSAEIAEPRGDQRERLKALGY